MTTPDTSAERRALARRLTAGGNPVGPRWRAAVEAVPRETFLRSGVFLPVGDGTWQPGTEAGTTPAEWVATVYSDQSLVPQLDGRVSADRVTGPQAGFPTSSSTVPATVVA